MILLDQLFCDKSYFDKNFVTKKLVKWNHSYLKYALEGWQSGKRSNNLLKINQNIDFEIRK